MRGHPAGDLVDVLAAGYMMTPVCLDRLMALLCQFLGDALQDGACISFSIAASLKAKHVPMTQLLRVYA